MDVALRVHQRVLVVLTLLLGVTAAACGGGSGSDSGSAPYSPMTSATSEVVESSDVPAAPPFTTTQTTQQVPTPPDTSLPAVLVGEWSASSSESGALELVLDADGTFRQYGSSFDWRGTATVHGSLITFNGFDGRSDTSDWSISGGTLTLAGIPYLKASAGTGGSLALVGTWMGMDDIFETLVFNDNGTIERHHDAEGTVTGTFEVHGNSLTIQLAGHAATTATWSVSNGILTIRSSVGTVKQYARSG